MVSKYNVKGQESFKRHNISRNFEMALYKIMYTNPAQKKYKYGRVSKMNLWNAAYSLCRKIYLKS